MPATHATAVEKSRTRRVRRSCVGVLLRQIRLLAHLEARFFRGSWKPTLAALAVALIPALYMVIYLASVWDPGANSSALQVGLVNLDSGLVYRDQNVNMGSELVDNLELSGRFGYRRMDSADLARKLVREGTLEFALIIPPDFSSNALPGAKPGAGKLVVVASQGNNYEAAHIAQLFAVELGHKVNESLNEQRWALVLLNAAGSKNSVERLREGAIHLHEAASELTGGTSKAAIGAKLLSGESARLADGVSQLNTGVKQLGAGLRTLDARRPRNSELTALNAGAEALVAAHLEMDKALQTLQNGSHELSVGITAFKDEADNSILVRPAIRDAINQTALGMDQLDKGLQTAVGGHQKLSEGAGQLGGGVTALSTGVRSMNQTLRTMVNKLPEDAQLDTLSDSAAELAHANNALAHATEKISSASGALRAGTELLTSALPGAVDSPEGSAQGLANSVQPVMEMASVVENSGSAFAANVIPAALWLGAGIAAFFINLRVLPASASRYHPVARLLGKIALPLFLVLVQSLLVLLCIFYVLAIRVSNPAALACTVVTASVTFLLVVCALTRVLGDAGKALAMIFLAVQLSSSGGVLPVELSGSFFANMSPWLPITWVVQGLKASMFGAYDGAWQTPWHMVLAAGGVAALSAVALGRWRYLPRHKLRPALDL